MKKTLLIFITIVSVLTYGLSCKKKQAEKPVQHESNVQTLSANSCTPENNANPEDNVGYKHNLRLSAIINTQYPQGASYQAISNALSVWCAQNSPVPYNQTIVMNTMQMVDQDQVNNFSNIISQLNLSAHAKTYVSYIINMGNTTQNISYCQFKSLIVSKEASILSDPALNNSEKSLLLGAYSIARYSGYYTSVVNPQPQTVGMKVPRWIRILYYDYIGYLNAYDLALANGQLVNAKTLALDGAAAASGCGCLMY